MLEGYPLGLGVAQTWCVPPWEWMYSAVASVVLLLIGLWAFRRTELRMVDRL